MERTLCARKTDARRKYLELNPAFPCHEAAKIVKSLNYLHARREPPGRNIEESPDYKEGEERLTVREVRDILGARVLVGEDHLDREVRSACGSDMMSDVLAFSKDHSILLTGLCNAQVIRTAEMLDIVCLIFVRGKKPDEAMLEMAEERGLIVMATGHRMFSACGMLYEAGLHSGAI